VARVTIQDALDYCLVNPDSLSVEELLTKFTEYRDELQPLLALGANIASLEPPPVPIDRRAAMKQRLMAAASAAAPTAAIIPQKNAAPAARPWWESLAALVRRPALAGALGAVAVVALLWWSAAGSLPDNPLYGLKLTSEDALRNFTSGTSGRIDSYLGSADDRLNDVKEMQRRDKLAQAGPAIDNYRSSIVNSATLWEQTSGEERTNLAKKLYISTAQGVVGLDAIAPDVSNIASAVRANIGETIDTLEKLRADTGGTLLAADIDVNALLLEADIEPSSLPGAAPGTATVTVPAVTTKTSSPRATETAVLDPTATNVVQQTSIPTSTRVAPRATRTVQPPTARPATNTPRPPQATATSRATNTRILPQPTNTPIVATLVPRTAVPTSTRAPSATRPASTFTPVPTPMPTLEPTPSRTPILILTQVPTLPTVTVEPPVLSTRIPNTPRPTNTHIPPLPTGLPITPLPLLTVTIVLPPPPPLPTLTPLPILTPLPLPTEILCELELEDVEISCGLGLCLNTSAVVQNESSSAVSATWTAELRVKVGSGNYIILSTQTGREEFAPGDTLLEPRFCVPLPVGTNRVQVRLSLSYAGCLEQESSGAMQPCGLP